ncbi:glycosyltransferase family 2 protein, partial [Elizabethkingia meningoseptica]
MKNIFPKVSVVMITYGHQNYIIEAIRSVLLQNYDGIIELIIANDCSPDNTDKIINNYLENNLIPDN